MLQDVSNCFDDVLDHYLQRMERKRQASEDAHCDAVNRQRLEQLREVATQMKNNVISKLVENQDFWALDENSSGAGEQRELLQAKATASAALEEVEQKDIERCRELETLLARKKQEEKELIDEIQKRMKAVNEQQMQMQDQELKRFINEVAQDVELPLSSDGDDGNHAAKEEIMRLLDGINQNTRACTEEANRLEERRRELVEVEKKLTNKAMGLDTHLHFDDDTLEGSQLDAGGESSEDEDTEADTRLKTALESIPQAAARFESCLP